MRLYLRMEEEGRKEGGRVGYLTQRCFFTLCSAASVSKRYLFYLLRTDRNWLSKYLGCSLAENCHLRKNTPNKVGTKSGGLDASPSTRTTPVRFPCITATCPDRVILLTS